MTSDEETGQTLIAGMGELHLEIIVDRLLREFKVDANVGRPQVAYRETISKPAEKAGQVRAPDRRLRTVRRRRHQPAAQTPGAGYEFVDKIVGGKIPKEYIPAINAASRRR